MAYDEDYLFEDASLSGPGFYEKSGYVIIGKLAKARGKVIDSDGDVVTTTLGEWNGNYIHETHELAEEWAESWWGRVWKERVEIGFISLRYSIDPVGYSDAEPAEAEDDGLDGVDLDEDLDAPLEEGGTVTGRTSGPAIPALAQQIPKAPKERAWRFAASKNSVSPTTARILDKYQDKVQAGTATESELQAMWPYEFTEK